MGYQGTAPLASRKSGHKSSRYRKFTPIVKRSQAQDTAIGRPPLPMPLYSMFCMAKPAIGRAAVGSMMRLAGTTVLNKGGVLTDIVSFGQQDLAYDIRNQGVKYSQVRGSRTPPAIC